MSGWFLVVAGDFSVPFLLLEVATDYLMSLNVVRFHRRHWWQSCYLWAGTGKILSIIFSALQWLVDRKQHQNNDSLVDLVDIHLNGKNGDCVGSDEEPDWLRNSFGSKEVESPKKKVKVKKRLGFSSKQRDETEIEESFRDLYS
ncbi:hypothetical protein Hdeb2414_s0025g00663411 [Helianthus debilis subsp. tardiflorus]